MQTLALASGTQSSRSGAAAGMTNSRDLAVTDVAAAALTSPVPRGEPSVIGDGSAGVVVVSGGAGRAPGNSATDAD